MLGESSFTLGAVSSSLKNLKFKKLLKLKLGV